MVYTREMGNHHDRIGIKMVSGSKNLKKSNKSKHYSCNPTPLFINIYHKAKYFLFSVQAHHYLPSAGGHIKLKSQKVLSYQEYFPPVSAAVAVYGVRNINEVLTAPGADPTRRVSIK